MCFWLSWSTTTLTSRTSTRQNRNGVVVSVLVRLYCILLLSGKLQILYGRLTGCDQAYLLFKNMQDTQIDTDQPNTALVRLGYVKNMNPFTASDRLGGNSKLRKQNP